ncbi:MAG: hypothetical protein V4819_02745 [Verrucomicrobiota bacterium]
MRLFLLIAISSILVSCSKGLPPLRTWEVAAAPVGSKHVEFSFAAPLRDSSKSYWDYQLGIVLPKDAVFDLVGEVKIFSKSGEQMGSFRFDSATNSSWLRDEARISHLLTGNLGVEDGKEYRVEIEFERPLVADTAVVLHFLSHTNSPAQIIKEANMPAQTDGDKPSN